MSEWKKIYQIEELKELINTSHTEITESLIRNQIQTSFSVGKPEINSNKKNYYFSSDGYWHVYNPFMKIWTKQENVRKNYNYNNNFSETRRS